MRVCHVTSAPHFIPLRLILVNPLLQRGLDNDRKVPLCRGRRDVTRLRSPVAARNHMSYGKLA